MPNAAMPNAGPTLDGALPRRDFLRTGFYAATAVASGIAGLVSAQVEATVDFKLPSLIDPPSTRTNKDRTALYPKTDSLTTLPEGVVIRNLGVLHQREFLAQHHEHIEAAVFDSDIVLCEFHPAFSRYINAANKLGKEAWFIEDPSEMQASGSKGLISGLFCLFAAYKNTRFALESNGPPSLRKEASRFGFAAGSWVAALASLPGLANLPFIYTGNTACLKFDLGPATAGRSVIFLDRTYRKAAESPGKRILLLTGDGHASYMQHLLQAGPESREFKAKLAIFKRVAGVQE